MLYGMGWFKKVTHPIQTLAHALTAPIERILPSPLDSIAIPLAGFAIGGPAGAAIASGVKTYGDTGSIGKSLLSAGGSYVGSNIGNAILPTPNIADALETSLGSDLGSAAVNAVGGDIANTSLGATAGGYFGGNIASSLSPQKDINPTGEMAAGSTPFMPTQQAEQAPPPSLASLSSFSPLQQASNIATGGVYGGGQGPDEQSYFLNLINRQLVDPQGHLSDISSLNPIENSYLSQMGLGGYGNPKDLLQAIQGWHA